jgi:hypothetical protein
MDQYGMSGARNTLIVALAAALLAALGMALYAGLSGAAADEDSSEPRVKCIHDEAPAPSPEIKGAPPPVVKKVAPGVVHPAGKPSLEAACGPKAGLMLRAPELSPKKQREMREDAEKNAQCLRDHGIDVGPVDKRPDGGIALRLPDGFDPTSENARRAEKACADELPLPPPPPPR